MKINKDYIIDNLKTLFYALVIALLIRSLLIQPFYIPSSSMEPNLLVGDRLFVTKYSYGYSKHSFHLVHHFSKAEFSVLSHKEVMLLFLKLLQTIEQIILKNSLDYQEIVFSLLMVMSI